MKLMTQFRVLDSSGRQHTLACYQDSHQRATKSGCSERVDAIRHYRLNGCNEVQRIDDDTFVTSNGAVLQRAPAT
jgi:hypothetical protein